MAKCPVCMTPSPNNGKGFCKNCGYDLSKGAPRK
jgi:predicted amidophosphoribosyltransferase